MAEEPEQPETVDLTQFSSLDDAFEKAKPGGRYTEVGKLAYPLGPGGMAMNLAVAFWFAMITHAQGLHSAVAREISENNPHAVFPLIRAFFEALLVLIYVLGDPAYIKTLVTHQRELPEGERKRKSIQALISYAKPVAPGMKDLYDELSEATHFGSHAMWTSMVIEGEGEDGLRTSWASHPRWRDDEQALIACAQILELADAMEYFLRQFFDAHVRPLKEAGGVSP